MMFDLSAWDVHFDEDQPRDEDGKWTSGGGGTRTDIVAAAKAGQSTPPIQPAREPRWPLGKSKVGGKAGGFSASGRKNTTIGDQAEWLLEQSGAFQTALSGGDRRGAFDTRWDHSGMHFEVKAVSVQSTEYKVKWKAAEKERKEAAAKAQKLKAGTMIVVMDHAKGTADVFWRPGLGAWQLNVSNYRTAWNYAGRVTMPARLRSDPGYNPKAVEREARKSGKGKHSDDGQMELLWDEDLHPRDEAGRFSDGGGSSGHREGRLSGDIDSRSDSSSGINVTQVAHFSDGGRGIFKPSSGEHREKVRDGIKPGKQAEREAGAWEVAKLVGMDDLVPATVIREVNGARGSMQEYADGVVAFEADVDSMHDGPKDAVRAAIFDYVIGNMDRHRGNWILSMDARGQHSQLHLIDHGLAFPESIEVEASSPNRGSFARHVARMVESAAGLPESARSAASEMAASFARAKPEIVKALRALKLPRKAIDGVIGRIDALPARVAEGEYRMRGAQDARFRKGGGS